MAGKWEKIRCEIGKHRYETGADATRPRLRNEEIRLACVRDLGMVKLEQSRVGGIPSLFSVSISQDRGMGRRPRRGRGMRMARIDRPAIARRCNISCAITVRRSAADADTLGLVAEHDCEGSIAIGTRARAGNQGGPTIRAATADRRAVSDGRDIGQRVDACRTGRDEPRESTRSDRKVKGE